MITGLVFYAGDGKLRGILAVFYGCMAFAAGAVFGMILARREPDDDEAADMDVAAAEEDDSDANDSQR